MTTTSPLSTAAITTEFATTESGNSYSSQLSSDDEGENSSGSLGLILGISLSLTFLLITGVIVAAVILVRREKNKNNVLGNNSSIELGKFRICLTLLVPSEFSFGKVSVSWKSITLVDEVGIKC